MAVASKLWDVRRPKGNKRKDDESKRKKTVME